MDIHTHKYIYNTFCNIHIPFLSYHQSDQSSQYILHAMCGRYKIYLVHDESYQK